MNINYNKFSWKEMIRNDKRIWQFEFKFTNTLQKKIIKLSTEKQIKDKDLLFRTL